MGRRACLKKPARVRADVEDSSTYKLLLGTGENSEVPRAGSILFLDVLASLDFLSACFSLQVMRVTDLRVHFQQCNKPGGEDKDCLSGNPLDELEDSQSAQSSLEPELEVLAASVELVEDSPDKHESSFTAQAELKDTDVLCEPEVAVAVFEEQTALLACCKKPVRKRARKQAAPSKRVGD